MIESYEKLSSIGFENVILILLLSLVLGVGYFKAKDYICERFGIETKRSLKEKKRDEEISTLVTSISELAQTFKDLQMLVQEQGTILDRIDYNIDSALDNTKDAHKQLQKANENMKKNCFRNATMSLLVVIFIEAVLILLKFTS